MRRSSQSARGSQPHALGRSGDQRNLTFEIIGRIHGSALPVSRGRLPLLAEHWEGTGVPIVGVALKILEDGHVGVGDYKVDRGILAYVCRIGCLWKREQTKLKAVAHAKLRNADPIALCESAKPGVLQAAPWATGE